MKMHCSSSDFSSQLNILQSPTSLWQGNKTTLRSSQQLNHAKPQGNNALTRAKVEKFSKTVQLAWLTQALPAHQKSLQV